MKTALISCLTKALARRALVAIVFLSLLWGGATRAQTHFQNFTLLSTPQSPDLFLVDQWDPVFGYKTKIMTYKDLFNSIANGTLTLITTNWTTNSFFYYTNLYVTNAYVSNVFATNIFVNNTYASNIFTTNFYSTNAVISNAYITNLTVQNFDVSNFFATNLTVVNDTFVSNFFATNVYAPVIISSNFYTTNSYTTNLIANTIITSNLFATNIFTTNLYSSNIYTTNIYGKTIYVTAVDATQGIFTNIGFYTNYWSGPTNELLMILQRQRYQTYTPCSITGINGKSDGTFAQSVLLTITNASATNIPVYLAAGITTGNYTNCYWISNGTAGKFWFEYDPAPETNAIFRQFQ